MEKISELMDGELEAQECSNHLQRLCKDPQLAKRWDQYHLIRDVLRSEAGTRVDLVASMHARLEAEPTILAPRRRVQTLIARVALPAAAAIAGVVVGGWLSSSPSGPLGGQEVAKDTTSPASVVSAAAKPAAPPPVVVELADGQVNELILAHQEFSPTSAMQGAASYVRTLSVKGSDNAR
jgi:sigma-E factor negative regulatory protein RseA